MIREDDKRIVPRTWQKELDGLKEQYREFQKPYSDTVINLARIEVLNHNRRDLERMLENERNEREKDHYRSREKNPGIS